MPTNLVAVGARRDVAWGDHGARASRSSFEDGDPASLSGQNLYAQDCAGHLWRRIQDRPVSDQPTRRGDAWRGNARLSLSAARTDRLDELAVALDDKAADPHSHGARRSPGSRGERPNFSKPDPEFTA